MKKIYTLLFCAFALQTMGQNGWLQKNNFGGTARYGASGFSVNGKGYICMGLNGNTNFNDLWEYNPQSDSWTQKANCPGAVRRVAVAFSIGSLGYMGTGYNGTHLNDFWQYNPNGNSWTQKTNFGGSARYGAIGFAINGKGYIGLGNEGSASGPFPVDIWEYNPLNDTWIQRQNFPGNGRYSGVGISIGSKGYVFCGVGGNGSAHYNDSYMFDPLSNSWAQKANLPGPQRGYPFAFSIGSFGYVGGGKNANIFYDVYCYSPSCNTWIQVQNYASNGGYISASFTINGSGYVGTGYDFVNYYNDLWEYRPVCTMNAPTISNDDSTATCQGDTVTLTSSSSVNYSWSNGATSQSISVISAGNYSVTVTDGNSCCLGSLPFSVSFSPAPSTPVISQNNSLLACSESGMSSYEWFLNGNAFPSCSTQFCTCPQDGFYTVTITNSSGCSSTSNLFSATGCGSGINEAQNEVFQVYFNQGKKTVSVIKRGIAGNFQVSIYNVLGEKIIGKNIYEANSEIDLSSQTAGIYFLNINYGERNYNDKIVIQ